MQEALVTCPMACVSAADSIEKLHEWCGPPTLCLGMQTPATHALCNEQHIHLTGSFQPMHLAQPALLSNAPYLSQNRHQEFYKYR